jgi:hypothetical protein
MDGQRWYSEKMCMMFIKLLIKSNVRELIFSMVADPADDLGWSDAGGAS